MPKGATAKEKPVVTDPSVETLASYKGRMVRVELKTPDVEAFGGTEDFDPIIEGRLVLMIGTVLSFQWRGDDGTVTRAVQASDVHTIQEIKRRSQN